MTNDQYVQYGSSESASRAIHSALCSLEAAPPSHRITKWAFTWNVDGTLATATASEGLTVLFTLTYAWNIDGTLANVERA